MRFRRALFPGYSDTVEYMVSCPTSLVSPDAAGAVHAGNATELGHFDLPRAETGGRYHVTAVLLYRKVDQFLLNYLLGEDAGVTAPVTEIARATATVVVDPDPENDADAGAEAR